MRAFSFLLLLALLSACTTPLPPPDTALYDREAATGVFSAGFEGITGFYIEEIDLPSLALSGLQGLRDIDGTITITEHAGRLLLAQNGRNFAAFPIPEPDDVARWSILSATAIEAMRKVSPELRAASPEMLYNLVFRNALGNLDRFSRYTPARDAARNRAHRRGYSGIGIVLVAEEGLFRIREIFDDGPAAASGLRAGDGIVAIDGRSLSGLGLAAVSELLRGRDGTPVAITILDVEELTRTITVPRAPVIEQTVYPARHGNSAYFRIRGFNEATATSLRRKVTKTISAIGPGANGIILDLRHNRGGVLRDAISIADLFIRDGRILLTKGRHPRSEKEFSAENPDIATGMPLIVLIDRNSASASEVVAGALQDSGRAVLIGSRTYGKGTVQMIVRLPNDGELIVTWAKMYTPSGYPIGPFGVYPTICTAETGNRPFTIDNTVADKARGLLRLRRIARDLDENIRETLLARCGERTGAAAGGEDMDLELALHLLGNPEQFERAFEASQIASRWPAGSR